MIYRSSHDGIVVEIDTEALNRPDCNCLGSCPDCTEETL